MKESALKSDRRIAPGRFGLAPGASASRHGEWHVWDLPLRVFHWSLVIAVAILITTGEAGGAWMDVHGKAGVAVIGLLGFRMAWGFVGSTHARFADFLPTPARLGAYLRGVWRGAGHNPLGACSVIAMLAVLCVQALTGLFSRDDISFSGPWYASIDDKLAGQLTGVHDWGAWALFVLLALHASAIAFYALVRRQALVGAMLTGRKAALPGPAPVQAGVGSLLLAVGIAVAAAYLASGGAWFKAAPAPGAAKVKSEHPAW